MLQDGLFRIDIIGSEPLIWSYGWCATSEDNLTNNFEYIELEFSLDDMVIPPSQIAISEVSLPGNLFCRINYTVVDQWPLGEYQLEIQVTFTQPINDGQNVFPKGTHTFRYIVTVEE